MELSSSGSRGYQGRQMFGEKNWKTLHKLPLRALPGSERRCQGKFILGEEVWLLSTAPFKPCFSLVTRSSQERSLKSWLCAPLLSLFLWPSHLGRWAEAFRWAPALGWKGTHSTSAFGGKLWLSSSDRPWGVALADPH